MDTGVGLFEYQRLEQLSRQMLDAARSGQWERLVELERERAGVVDGMRQDRTADRVSATESARIAAIIEEILKLDAETQSLAASWRDELQGLLGSMNTERRLSKTYGP